MQTRENKKKSIVSAPLRAKFIEAAFGVFRFLPRRAIVPLSGFLAKCSSALNTRAFATTRTNLENCLPELAAEDRKQLALRSIREDWKIEQIVRRRPEQYLWSYKRFKTPASGRNFYLK